MTAWAVIVAGGSGTRMGSKTPKQLLTLKGVTILERTLKPFTESTVIDGIVIVAGEAIYDEVTDIINASSLPFGECHVVRGGAERQQSVMNGIARVPESTDIVLIHDAVRPFIRPDDIAACVTAAHRHGAVSVMRPVKETVKVVKDGIVMKTPDRATLRITQTPQAFKRELIVEAHHQATEDGFTGTDDCMLVERLGHTVHIVEGNDMNIKITTPADLAIAEALLSFFNS